MSMQNSIYGGIPGPSWYVFDKVHIGSAKDLLNQASSDGIFIGRYVLVKYCESLLEAEERTLLESLSSETQILDDPTGDKKLYFTNYKQDGATQSYDRVVFQKIYKNNKITYHAICNLHQIQNIIIQPGEGGGTVVNPIRITMIDPEPPEATDNDILQNIIDNNQGDIVIIRRQIANDKYSYTSYVYDSTLKWMAMDGNYSAENVFFKEDLITTHAIGNIQLTNGQGTITAAGKNLKQVFDTIFVQEKNPTKTNPSVTITLAAASKSPYEVGTVVSSAWNASFDVGRYTYGPHPTGVEINNWSVTDSNNSEPIDNTSGDFGDITITDETSYMVIATVSHTAGEIPLTNLGNQTTDSSLRIAEGEKKKQSASITGYRAFFYGMSNTPKEDFELNSTTIRNLTNGGNYNSAKTLTFTAKDLPGVKRFIVAVPNANTRAGLISAKITSSMGADATSNYIEQDNQPFVYGLTETTTQVPYKVWIYEPASIADVEIHEVKLG